MIDIVLLVFATCFDSFLMSVAYGVENIRLPRKAILIIAFCGTFFLGLAMVLANGFAAILPSSTCHYVSFGILFALGFFNIFQAQMKHYIKKHKDPLVIKIKGISLVIDVFLDEKSADIDQSKDISVQEALYLGIALSLDSLASGLGYGIGSGDIRLLLGCSFLIGILLIYVGNYLGKHFSNTTQKDFSWISGCMLMVLACMRLL